MGMISEIIKKGWLDNSFPRETPSITLSKEQQSKLNQGHAIVVRDQRYKAQFLIRKDNLDKALSRENLILEPLDNMKLNPVRNTELAKFYAEHPKYRP